MYNTYFQDNILFLEKQINEIKQDYKIQFNEINNKNINIFNNNNNNNECKKCREYIIEINKLRVLNNYKQDDLAKSFQTVKESDISPRSPSVIRSPTTQIKMPNIQQKPQINNIDISPEELEIIREYILNPPEINDIKIQEDIDKLLMYI